MLSTVRSRLSLFAACSPLVLAGCAQGAMSVSPGTILSAIVLAGDVMGAHGGSTTTRTSGSSRPTVDIPRSPAPTAVASRVLGTARQYVGVRYTWGGNSPGEGFDCSGYTKYVFARQGIALPRTSREQAHAGEGVRLDFGEMIPGDLLLFAEPNAAISHVAIYMGDGEIIQSSSARGEVGYLDLRGAYGGWYLQNLVAVRRVMGGG
jgi:cell wall-associated NlpC family hydrolase